ncbi:3-dehydroquinate synthase [Ammoniphilus sp. CFH 90114]|uniref:3-dehydroquinate synthase n=1 Tax=Ammoniphilus sp. CFH 90114 TaxID=2493665 RepID=UPI00100E8B19|nr:3-dehydroquinate synthase [Ammoniphilus sp. CFH 90114]RXT13910.1 3-dehydroquinate synthase [Ammoniphilus sp. CFH 90114]
MKRLTVDLGERSYPIVIGKDILGQLPQELADRGITSKNRLLIVTDHQVAPLYLERVQSILTLAGYEHAFHVISAGEQAKTLSVLEEVTGSALKAGLDRKSVFIALGGGVVGDLTGFCAATYMRGVPFVQIPTTLLAHDSSVGGKVAVNHPMGKNIIGAFHQPSLVLYDTETLKTLPPREIYAGFAEVIKHGLIWSESFTDWLEQHAENLLALQSPYIDEAIYQGCLIKSQVVSEDETEQGKRAILNLGHTFGHAMESLSHYGGLIHGEAVAIGMVAAAVLAERIGICDPNQNVSSRTIELLKKFQLPVQIPAQFQPDALLEAMRLDKKGSGGKLVFVLPKSIGAVEIVRDVPEDEVIQVLKLVKEVE